MENKTHRDQIHSSNDVNFQLLNEFVENELNSHKTSHKTEDCLSRVNEEISNDALLKDNKCIAREICSQPKVFTDAFLKAELRKYFPVSYSMKSHSENSKIKDDIDETIYDVIRYALKDKAKKTQSNEKMLEKIDCFADYIKRNNKMDKLYNTELIFDQIKLLKVVQPLFNEYNLSVIND